MTQATGTILLNEDGAELFAGLTNERKGKSVYHKKIKPGDVDYRICRIHFFYFKIENGKLVARHYLEEGKPAPHENWTDFVHEAIDDMPNHPDRERVRINDALQVLLANARKQPQNQNPKHTGSINTLAFKERSFLAFCFDHADWTFPDDLNAANGLDNEAVFFSEGGALTPNHSFFDGRTAFMSDGRPIFYMVNHAKRSDADDDLQGGDKQPIKYNIVVKVPMAGGEKLTVIFDPGGTNLGPPDPP